jgi:hypothetical protein
MKLLSQKATPSQPRQTRQPYTTTDIRYVHAHYKDCTAAELAQQLGRTLGSLKNFIQRQPDLRKYPHDYV